MDTIPQFIVGTYQCDNYRTLLNVVQESLECGITGFDTAPSYNTEPVLGKVLKEVMRDTNLNREDFFICDKIDAWQMRKYNGDIKCFLNDARKKLQTDYLDLLLIHWPIEEYFEKTWESMMEYKEKGDIKNIGVCNIRRRHLELWKKKGIIPSFVQIERHPLRTCKDEMDYCQDEHISVLSYSPLGRMLPQIKESTTLKEIASKYNKNVGQIILRWQIDTNAIPVFASKTPGRIINNTNVRDFHLDSNEIERIESLNSNYKIYLESWGCPGF